MAAIRPVEPVMRFCAVIAGDERSRQWGIDRLRRQWGDVAEVTAPAPFEAGGFYDAAMGAGLQKVLVGMSVPCNPAGLADWKSTTNRWEDEWAEQADAPVPRPLNLDPGYVTQAKLVLATTKDRDHRLYLRDGMFAEVTLNYVAGRWVHHRWTYPDYRTEQVKAFAQRCRDRLRTHLQAGGGFRRV